MCSYFKRFFSYTKTYKALRTHKKVSKIIYCILYLQALFSYQFAHNKNYFYYFYYITAFRYYKKGMYKKAMIFFRFLRFVNFKTSPFLKICEIRSYYHLPHTHANSSFIYSSTEKGILSVYKEGDFITCIEKILAHQAILEDYYFRYILARALFSLNEISSAQKLFKNLLKINDPSIIWLNSHLYMSTIFRTKGKYFHSLRLLRSVIRIFPDELKYKAFYSIALAYQQAGYINQALKWYDRAAKDEEIKKRAEHKIYPLFITANITEEELKGISFRYLTNSKEAVSNAKKEIKRIRLIHLILHIMPVITLFFIIIIGLFALFWLS